MFFPRVVSTDTSSALCDCHLRWLAEWANATGARGVDGARCAHPVRQFPLKKSLLKIILNF